MPELPILPTKQQWCPAELLQPTEKCEHLRHGFISSASKRSQGWSALRKVIPDVAKESQIFIQTTSKDARPHQPDEHGILLHSEYCRCPKWSIVSRNAEHPSKKQELQPKLGGIQPASAPAGKRKT